MAIKDCTIVSQGWGNASLNLGYGKDAAYAGLGGDTYFVTSLKFTTPAFAGAPSSIDFSIVMGNSGYNESSSRLRYALCTSDANISRYENTAAAVTDPYQIASGIAVVSGSLGAYDVTNIITVDARAIMPSTTYYLVLWAGNKVTGYGQGMGLDGIKDTTPSAKLTYYSTYTLSILQGEGSVVTVKDSSGHTLSNGATITHGDVLTISFDASTGYSLETHTVNGATFGSGSSLIVTGDVSVMSKAALKTFTLSFPIVTGITVRVERNGTKLRNGATVSYGDFLIITFAAADGYCLKTHTVNGVAFSSGDTHKVTDNVLVEISADILAYPIGNGAGRDLYYAYIGDGAGGGAYYVAYIGTDDGPTLYGSET